MEPTKNFTPRIELLNEKKLIGLHVDMSLADNKTPELWRSFMPRRKEILNQVSTDLFSLQIYQPGYFENLNPLLVFKKWACVEVSTLENIPADMQAFSIESGTYAVFNYKGSSTDNSVYEYIFNIWLPGADYDLDQRPHFEILGPKYNNYDTSSEEEIWIPVKLKNTILKK